MPNGLRDREQFAFAKLTTRLHMVGVRADGYHLIDAEMVSLDFGDSLAFSDGDGLSIDGPASIGIPVGDENLIRRALRAAGVTSRVSVTKRIPPGAGLGGGSSNAAAAFRYAGVTSTQVAAEVGADVPFCLRGGRANVTGIGDVVQPLEFEQRVFTLVVPPFGVNTAAAYRAFDELGDHVCRAEDSTNHLWLAARTIEPRLSQWREKFGEHTGVVPVLAGSGSTMFVEGEFPEPPANFPPDAVWQVARTTRAIDLG